jgi:hypothetical protein
MPSDVYPGAPRRSGLRGNDPRPNPIVLIVVKTFGCIESAVRDKASNGGDFVLKRTHD